MESKTLLQNKKANFNYELIKKFEAGIVLLGFEVKSLKNKLGSFEGAYVIEKGGEYWLKGMYIAPYQPANTPTDYNPYRMRKLLLNKKEMHELDREHRSSGLTIIPVSLYNKGSLIKVSIALARGKKNHDKRHDIKKKDLQRELGRRFK
jgi:SsrA-binding protein